MKTNIVFHKLLEYVEERDGLQKKRKTTLETDGLEIVCVTPIVTINTDVEDDLVFVKEERSVFRTELPQQDQVHERSLEGMYRSIFLNEAEAKLGRFERNYLGRQNADI